MFTTTLLQRALGVVTVGAAIGTVGLAATTVHNGKFNPVPEVTHTFVCDDDSNGGGMINFVLTNKGFDVAHIHVVWTVSNGGGQYDLDTLDLSPQPWNHPVVEDETVSFQITNTDPEPTTTLATTTTLAPTTTLATTTTLAPTTTVVVTLPETAEAIGTTLVPVVTAAPTAAAESLGVLPATGGSGSWMTAMFAACAAGLGFGMIRLARRRLIG